MKILGNRVLVSKVQEPKPEGFETVQVTDSFVYKGKVEQCSWPESDTPFKIGDIVLFAKYSPDTQDVEHEGVKYKAVKVDDIIAVL